MYQERQKELDAGRENVSKLTEQLCNSLKVFEMEKEALQHKVSIGEGQIEQLEKELSEEKARTEDLDTLLTSIIYKNEQLEKHQRELQEKTTSVSSSKSA